MKSKELLVSDMATEMEVQRVSGAPSVAAVGSDDCSKRLVIGQEERKGIGQSYSTDAKSWR